MSNVKTEILSQYLPVSFKLCNQLLLMEWVSSEYNNHNYFFKKLTDIFSMSVNPENWRDWLNFLWGLNWLVGKCSYRHRRVSCWKLRIV